MNRRHPRPGQTGHGPRTIREGARYAGVRVTMDAGIGTALVKLRLDVNFGDPVTPEPRVLELPALRPGVPPIRVLGYPIETVLAGKIVTAIELGAANTRVRDFADIHTVTGSYDIEYATARDALVSTARFRGAELRRLAQALGDIADLRAASYRS